MVDGQVTQFDPDSRAVAVADAHAAKDQAVDDRSRPAQHQRRLALAGLVLEDHRARDRRLEGDPPGLLNTALAIGAGRDHDRAVLAPDRHQRVLQVGEALPVFGDREGCFGRTLLGGGGNGESGGEDQERAHVTLMRARRFRSDGGTGLIARLIATAA